MSQQAISYADLSIINNALRSISIDISGVHTELGDLNYKQDKLETDLEKLAEAFFIFVEEDRKHKALQLAETRVGNLRQELQIKFGYFEEVRRMATGILQGVDSGVISDETLRFTTEEVMIKAPGYWLASSLVSLASWIRNDRTTSEKALQESLKRDDYKTTLFFMLVMRRLSRNEASLRWLERYFLHQNPHNLDREFIIILEAVTTGVFPPASRQLMMQNVKNWLDQLTQGDNFISEQKKQWVKFFEANGPLPDGNYPLLEKFATNWGDLELTMKECKTHEILNNHFTKIFASSYDFSKTTTNQLDEILSLLVTNFDDEELPLQQQVRMNQLIIQMDGDKNAAQAMIDAEKHIFDEKIDFLQMLTNAAFNPELSGATKVTQALAVSISQPWIIEAHDIFTINSRNRNPATINLQVEGFNCSSTDGSDENEVLVNHEKYWSTILDKELSDLDFPIGMVIIGTLLGLGGVYGFSIHPLIGIVGLGIGIVLIWNSINNYHKGKNLIITNIEDRKNNSQVVLRGCLAEIVDYRMETKKEDEKAEELRHLLSSITAEDFSSISVGAKSIIQTT
jgi:hypothetical protein